MHPRRFNMHTFVNGMSHYCNEFYIDSSYLHPEMVVQKMVVQAQGLVSEKAICNDLDYITQL